MQNPQPPIWFQLIPLLLIIAAVIYFQRKNFKTGIETRESLNTFAGWLKLLYYLSFIFFVVGAIQISSLVLLSIIGWSNISAETLTKLVITLFTTGPVASLNFLIHKKLKDPSPDVPGQIQKFLGIQIAIMFLGFILSEFILHLHSKTTTSQHLITVTFESAILTLWILYFHRSQRVRQFYGSNV